MLQYIITMMLTLHRYLVLLLLLVLLLFLYCWLRLCHLRKQAEETVTGGEAYRPQSIIDTLRQEMGE